MHSWFIEINPLVYWRKLKTGTPQLRLPYNWAYWVLSVLGFQNAHFCHSNHSALAMHENEQDEYSHMS